MRVYDNSYCTSLLLPASQDKTTLYTSCDDDSFIHRRGGESLVLSGYYLPDNEEYALIDSASINLFYDNGWSMKLLERPFIINTSTFKEYTVKELLKNKVLSEAKMAEVEKALNARKVIYGKREEIESKGGLAKYVSFLREMQDHIKEVAKSSPYQLERTRVICPYANLD